VRGRALAALPLLVAAAAVAAPPQHLTWTRAALARVPVSKHDRTEERAALHAANLDAFAAEIARVSEKAPLPPRQWASLLGAVGSIETNFDTEIVAGRCPPWACDRGRAKGAFQNQNVGPVADLWPTADGNIKAQVDMADRMLRRTWRGCEAQGVPFPAGAFRAYAGRSCSWPVHREQERVAAYVRLLATPSVKAGGAS
jgi:hypothetical protein